MKNKSLILRLILLVVLAVSVLYGIQLATPEKPNDMTKQCDLTLSSCSIAFKDKTIGLTFVHPPVTEEELFIKFQIPKGVKLKKAWIEGVNMYMGKTPVMFENQDQADTGVTFLGSCNLAEMRWVLYLEVVDTSNIEGINANSNIVSASFSTFL